ncbi:MAG: alginate export family protein [Proteobacteria bacterium]|jgi:hypothetical protein|nr:alginate export family protein [Pseudomonadota bacterium]
MLYLLTVIAFAGEIEFDPELQVRPRLEAHTGRDGDSSTGDSIAISQRSRLGATLSAGTVSALVQIQDVRIWGTEENTLTDFSADAIDLHQASLSWTPHEYVKLVVGRQEIAFHEQRLIGTVNWAQQARSFDAARVSAHYGHFSTDLVGAVTVFKDSHLAMLRLGVAKEKERQADFILVADQSTAEERMRVTTGVYGRAKFGIFSGRLETYYQAGTIGDSHIGALLAAVEVTISPEHEVKPSFTLWYDYLSGDKDLADSQISSFNTLFATNHKFYGQLDLMWFGVGGHKDGLGLQDAALKLKAVPTDGLTTKAEVHTFFAAANHGSEYLASEVDLAVAYKITPHLTGHLGGAVLFPSHTDFDAWSYLMLDVQL